MSMTSSLFCDGACRGNGRNGAAGGWAWAFWPGPATGHPTAYSSARLATGPGQPATNQRAELTALLEAVQWVQTKQMSVTIYSDSEYAIKCASLWGPSWAKAGWTRSSSKPLLNLDLIQPLVAAWANVKKRTVLKHVRGHQTGPGHEVYGNNWVDKEAVAGAAGEGTSRGLVTTIIEYDGVPDKKADVPVVPVVDEEGPPGN